MADLFSSSNTINLLKNKCIVLCGGSVIRGLYKDLIWLLNSNTLIEYKVLGTKGEERFPDLDKANVKKKHLTNIFHEENRDHLHNSGDSEDDFRGLNSGRSYVEVREYYNKENNILIIFKFIVQAYSFELDQWLKNIQKMTGRKLDILLINSSLWDVNRWGPFGHEDYKKNIKILIKNVPEFNCQFFWLTTPPIANVTDSKGMTTPGLEFQNFTTRYHVMEMNEFVANEMIECDMNVIDLGFSMNGLIHMRNKDGIHWSPEANRLMTNKILTHFCLSFGQTLPGNVKCAALERLKKCFLMKKNMHSLPYQNDLLWEDSSPCPDLDYLIFEKEENEMKKIEDKISECIANMIRFKRVKVKAHVNEINHNYVVNPNHNGDSLTHQGHQNTAQQIRLHNNMSQNNIAQTMAQSNMSQSNMIQENTLDFTSDTFDRNFETQSPMIGQINHPVPLFQQGPIHNSPCFGTFMDSNQHSPSFGTFINQSQPINPLFQNEAHMFMANNPDFQQPTIFGQSNNAFQDFSDEFGGPPTPQDHLHFNLSPSFELYPNMPQVPFVFGRGSGRLRGRDGRYSPYRRNFRGRNP